MLLFRMIPKKAGIILSKKSAHLPAVDVHAGPKDNGVVRRC